MDLFRNARAVRLKSVHGKYLAADEDQETVTQDRNGSSKSAKWTVEFVPDSDNRIRLKSCYGKYLTASNQPFLLGATGHKVLQTLPSRLDSSLSWEPIWENGAVKLKTQYGNYLRGNGGLPPWRNSVTHDVPVRTVTQESVSWEVHVVDFLPEAKAAPKAKAAAAAVLTKEDSFASESESPMASISLKSATFSRQTSNDSVASVASKGSDGRLIYYRVANEFGEVDEEFEELCITFKGSDVNELTWRLEEELGAEGITVCTRSPLNGKLYPLRLTLPPNNATMHIVVMPPSSKESVHQDSEEAEAAS